MSLSRRELFAMFRRPGPAGVPPVRDAAPRPATAPGAAHDRAASPAFSLDEFYARRGAEPGAAFPGRFTVRRDDAAVPSTRIGAGAIGEASGSGVALARRASPDRSPAAASRLGLASGLAWVPEVVPERCLARSFCTVCVERCPAPGAITLTSGGPRIDPARCDGCGVCVTVCPAPTLALQLVRREAP